MAYLRCADPIRKTSRDIVLRKRLISIGRNAGNDVVLKDGTVASTHANLLRKGDGYTLSVVQRTNEVYVNGRLVRQAELSAGDKLMVGRFELTLHAGQPKAEVASGPPSVDAMAQLVEQLEPSTEAS